MRTQRIVTITVLALPLAFGSYGHYNIAHAAPAGTAAVQDDDRYNDRDARDLGRRDGRRAAQEDLRDHRKADADDHDRYRHPPVADKHAAKEYRSGFKDGYNDAIRSGVEGVRDYNDRHDNDDYPR
jgi:hypothetical protein